MKKYFSYRIFHEISAGGVVFKKVKNKIYFVGIERATLKDRTLPKGHQRVNETLEKTALRETKEETGYKTIILDYIGNFTYKLKDARQKIILFRTVHWFLMKYTGGRKRKKNKEVKKVRWLSLQNILKFLSYKNDQNIVKEALKKIKQRDIKNN